MFDHVTLRASDRAASERFYTTVLPTLGIEPTAPLEWDDFSLAAAGDGEAVTRGLHIGFVAPTREHADAFWRAGTEAGYRDDGAPGPRPEYGDDYYGAFLLDPDGNSAEAVHHETLRTGGYVDHLWIRVADLRRLEGLLRGRGAARRLHDEHRHAGARPVRGRERLVLDPPRRRADGPVPHGLPVR